MENNHLQPPHRCFCRVKALLLCFFLATGALLAQNITIDVHQASIKTILKDIQLQTPYKFVYNDALVEMETITSLTVKNEPLESTLKKLLENKGISYEIKDQQIVLFPSKQTPVQTPHAVHGIIRDETGQPLPGAVITVKNNTKKTATSGIDGRFELADIDPNAVLLISFLGHETVEFKLEGRTAIGVSLKPSLTRLEEVVVVGYGSQKKVNLTGAVTTVKMDEVLGNRPISSSVLALEGAVPGLQVNRYDGTPGASTEMNIRGVTSRGGGGPIVLVDHVPMDLTMIDPNDIESISVLKDAAASAIYGARAAFGVILVTTKKGQKDQPTRVNYSNSFTFSNPTTLPVKVSPYETVSTYKEMELTAYTGGQNVDTWLNFLNEYAQGQYPEGYVWDNGIRYNLAATNAYKDMMDKNGFQQQHNISFMGGSQRIAYRASFGLVNEDGILATDTDKYTRYNVSSYISADATSWLTGQLDVRYAKATTSTAMAYTDQGGNTAIWSVATGYQSMGPLGYGEVSPGGDILPFGSPRNLIELGRPKRGRGSNGNILGRVIIKPITGLEITGEYSYYATWSANDNFSKSFDYITPVRNERATSISNANSTYSMAQGISNTTAINAYATYEKRIAEHHYVKIMGGYNQEAFYSESLEGKRTTPLDPGMPSLSLASGSMTTSDNFSETALRSLFYRVNYAYKDKYLLELNGRYDGSSRFPKKDRFGFFPSFSAGWRITEERFMNALKPYLSHAKLRASWGIIGNQNTAAYGYMSTMSPTDADWILPGDTKPVRSISTPTMVSASFTWEKIETLDIGVDMGFVGNRLNLVFDWYQRDTRGMMAPVKPLPNTLGGSAPQTNSASLRAKGWELSLEWRDHIGKDIHYNLGFKLYDSRSVMTDYNNLDGLIYSGNNLSYRTGMVFGDIWGYVTDRFYTMDDFDRQPDGTLKLKSGIPYFEGYPAPNPGDILYKNFDGANADGKLIINGGKATMEDHGDKQIIGNNLPRYQYSITGGFGWKSFDISLFFNGVGKRDLWNGGFWVPTGTGPTAVYDFQLDHWTEDNPNAYYPRLYGQGGNNGANSQVQTKYLMNGAYFRLKNVTIGYNLPKNICDKIKLQALRVFVSGENLFTWHHLPKGFNPDSYFNWVGSNQGVSYPGDASTDSGDLFWSYPLMRQFSFGLNITF